MILETVHLVAEALRDPEYGVNAQLANVQRFPADPMPPLLKRVYDVSKDNEASFKTGVPLEYPHLLVRADGPVQMTPEKLTAPDRFGEVPVLIRYAVKKEQMQQAFRAMAYTLRAICYTLDWFNHNAQTNEMRTSHDVQLWAMIDLEFGEFIEEVGDGIVVGAVSCVWQVRDAHQ